MVNSDLYYYFLDSSVRGIFFGGISYRAGALGAGFTGTVIKA